MINLLSVGFATYYITYLILYKDGPFDIFAKFRFFMGVNKPIYGIDNEIIGFEPNGKLLSKLVSCYTCLSFWVAIILVAVSIYSILIVTAIAAAGISNYLFDSNEATNGD